jgi:hypothetical protein
MKRTILVYRCIRNVEVVDEENHISRGIMILPANAPETVKRETHGRWIYFSTTINPDNDFDLIFPIIEWNNEDLFGVPFILVPKEKLLFAYDPPPGEGIILPEASIVKPKFQG